MTRKEELQKKKLLAEISDWIVQTQGERGLVAPDFVTQFFRNVFLEDLSQAAFEDLAGSVLAILSFAHLRTPGSAKIRVYNPTHEEHGWQSTHSVLEVINDDMPFLVDSLVAALNRLEITVHLLVHPVIRIDRDDEGRLVTAGGEQGTPESVTQIQLSRQPSIEALERLQDAVEHVLDDVRISVEDWEPMLGKVDEIIDELSTSPPQLPEEDVIDGRALLQWIRDDHFTFLGFRDYSIEETGGKTFLRIVEGSGLGLLRNVSEESRKRHEAPMSKALLRFARRKELLIITKASARSTIHRPVYMDYVGVRRFDGEGQVIGERRFLGLFTAAAYNRNPTEIPLLRTKVKRIIDRSGFRPMGHSAKALMNVLETFPRDELFQTTEEELYRIAQGIRHLEERQQIRLFVRRDSYARFFSCLVYVPRDRYNTWIRRRFEAILVEAFRGSAVEFTTYLSDSPMARVHYIVRTSSAPPTVDLPAIEKRLIEASRDWTDDLRDSLIERLGEAHGNELYQRYREAFGADYTHRFSPRTGAGDIEHIERVLDQRDIGMTLYHRLKDLQNVLHFKLYGLGKPMFLSEALPMLEHMGLKVIAEAAFEIKPKEDAVIWMHDFELQSSSGAEIDLRAVRSRFEEAFWRLWHGYLDDDGLNALVVAAGINWREVMILQAYHKYLRQAGITFSPGYVESTLEKNPAVVRLLIEFFLERFDPERTDPEEKAAIRKKVLSTLEDVANLNEDRILRRFLNLIECTIRTNFFQADSYGEPRHYLSVKLDSRCIEELPLPRPMVEVFVYSPRVEAVHLRGGKVARGGLRWSDRHEDFRTEVLGLMKAQMVKNAVIVPVGSKGGFVVKRPPSPTGDRIEDRRALNREVVFCYETMQRGLLDITDNFKDGKVVPATDVVRYDEDDPYLVVAADKGTATFSDIANSISLEYGHWLGDAFASGGSAGYDHKKMGITARGAWESVKRHFREIGVDTQTEDFTVLGVGDMGGDVFGNGMLLSKKIKLLGAFNHLHVFIDPDPDPERSWKERKRLFDGGLGWDQYDTGLISPGGGVFNRSAKWIALSEQVRELFGLEEERLAPADLIRAMLVGEVDLLWFGGIGTYIKSSTESNLEVGDRANDGLRVTADRVRAKVIGEGANLAVTQRGRIEYSRTNGRINTDAVDNSAGVDTSDHEVNIKILLDRLVADQDMTGKQRNRLLSEMTDEVAELVLVDNYQQSQAITIAQALGVGILDRQAKFMRALERSGRLNRAIEFLPNDEEIEERLAAGEGLSRPELSVLLAYSKMVLYDELLASDLPDTQLLVNDLIAYFPSPLREKYRSEITQHPLRREIIATYVTNSMVNRVGAAFVHELQTDTGMSASDIARAYAITRDAFELPSLWQEIESLDTQVPADVQTDMNLHVIDLIDRSARWFLRNGGYPLDPEKQVAVYHPALEKLRSCLPTLYTKRDSKTVEGRTGRYVDKGVPEDLARRVASLDLLSFGCDIVRIASLLEKPVVDVGHVYYMVGSRFQIDWLRRAASTLTDETHWQKLAARAFVDELFGYQSQLTAKVIESNGGTQENASVAVESWASGQSWVARTDEVLGDLRNAGNVDLAMLTVAAHQLRILTGD